jgi:hypothetical protein
MDCELIVSGEFAPGPTKALAMGVTRGVDRAGC